MKSKHSLASSGYPALTFNNKLAKTASLKHIRHQDKENFVAFQSRRKLETNHNTGNQNSSLAVNVARNYDLKMRAPLGPLSTSARDTQFQKRQLRSTLLRSVQDNNSQMSVKSLRNKSVKFNDLHLQMPHVQSSLNLHKELPRKRSGSILKSSRGNSLGSSQQFKSKSQFKYEQNKLGSFFTINEYKNTLVRERYNQMLRPFQKNQENCLKMNINNKAYFNKYTDSNFPPANASISKTKKTDSTWQRISQLCSNKDIVIFGEGNSPNKVYPGQCGSQQFAAVINLIGRSKSLLNRIFQNSTFNHMGVYLLKIFHEHEWKCIIIDDYIPTVKRQHKEEEPLKSQFLFTSINHKQKDVEIWPLLLEKAYASVISSYEQLHQSEMMSYLVEMMGLPLNKMKVQENKDLRKETQIFEKSDIMFGFTKKTKAKNNQIQRLVVVQKFEKNNRGEETIQLRQYSSNERFKIALPDLNHYVDELYFIKTSSMQHCTSTSIGNCFTIGRKIKSKRFFKESIELSQNDFNREKSIVKRFIIPSSDQISFLLKFKQNTDNNHKQTYWIRAILLMKQYNGYRWIEGKYAASHISFSCFLEAGEYYLVIVPDWTQPYHKELSLVTYSRINKIELKTFMENADQKMVEKGCTDYAQRRGKLIQISKYICAYTIVDEEAGLIIENINNERRNGSIKIFRNIKNLKPKDSYLLPYNQEFFVNNEMRNQITVAVQKEESYSVILMMFGGKDRSFMDSFSFGP